eukprot:5985832-Pyramimonas_sp.AAC.1
MRLNWPPQCRLRLRPPCGQPQCAEQAPGRAAYPAWRTIGERSRRPPRRKTWSPGRTGCRAASLWPAAIPPPPWPPPKCRH